MIGILGGTFDPIHCGHLHIAHELLQQRVLDNIIIVPAGQPSHRKPPIATPEQRLAMAKLAIADEEKIEIDDCEIKRLGPSYTIDTLHYFKKKYADKSLALIMGADAFAHFTQWHAWEDILTLCKIIVVNRPGSENTLNLKRKNIQHLTIPPMNISATAIRAGELSENILPEKVFEYIKKERLYN